MLIVVPMSRKIIHVYEFEDGTRIEVIKTGFSTQELWALEEIHGNYKHYMKEER